MKKAVIMLALACGLLLGGCGREGKAGDGEILPGGSGADTALTGESGGVLSGSPEADAGESAGNVSSEDLGANGGDGLGNADMEPWPECVTGREVVQGGPYGRISIWLPDGWSYETCQTDSDKLISGMYGIHFYPEEAEEGFIELAYNDFFGVCGTGLAEQTEIIAGESAHIGTYDNQEYWSFISFEGGKEGIVALTYLPEGWWSEYGGQVTDILDTLSFEPDVKEGGAYVYTSESEIDRIGLYFSLKNISSTGATMVFRQYDAEAPTGQLQFGEDFVVERKKDGVWEEVPVIVEGNYMFNEVAYGIAAGEAAERELDWRWLYGELSPGEYRISKKVTDFRGTGDYDNYTVYAQFILN